MPPEAFSPPPKVVSQVVRLRPVNRDWVDHDALFVCEVFICTAKKMLRQRFKPYLTAEDWEKLQVVPTQRPSDLSLEIILSIFNYIHKKGINI